MNLQNRIRSKNEATGIRVVGQFVQEFWECGWQPYDQRNDEGIDGIILMREKGCDLGISINVQVKCGPKYISSINDKEIRISVDDDLGLSSHIEYWRRQSLPTVLIYVNPCKPQRDKNGKIVKDKNGKIVWLENRLGSQAWWVNVNDENLKPEKTKTLIRLDKKNRFGEHSKGDFLKLIKPLLSTSHLTNIKLNRESKNLLNSPNLRVEARKFYQNWKNGNDVYCKAISEYLRVSRMGWRHILLSRRGKERRVISLKLLGVAKQMIEEVDSCYLLTQIETSDCLEQKYGLRAVIQENNREESVIQVILLRMMNKKTQKSKWWFYSVHYRR